MIHNILFSIVLIFLITLPFVTFFLWKQNNTLTFKEHIVLIWKKWKMTFFVLIGALIHKFFFPFQKHHGLEFNNQRKELGIVNIPKNWNVNNDLSGQFSTVWQASGAKKGHYKKIIIYNHFSIKQEVDYFFNNLKKDTILLSVFDYNTKITQYYLKPINGNEVSTNSTIEDLVVEPSNTSKKLTKITFNRYKNE